MRRARVLGLHADKIDGEIGAESRRETGTEGRFAWQQVPRLWRPFLPHDDHYKLCGMCFECAMMGFPECVCRRNRFRNRTMGFSDAEIADLIFIPVILLYNERLRYGAFGRTKGPCCNLIIAGRTSSPHLSVFFDLLPCDPGLWKSMTFFPKNHRSRPPRSRNAMLLSQISSKGVWSCPIPVSIGACLRFLRSLQPPPPIWISCRSAIRALALGGEQSSPPHA